MDIKYVENGVAGSLTLMMGVDMHERHARFKFVDFTQEDINILHALLPLIQKHASSIVDIFYDNVSMHSELLEIIQQAGSNIERLKSKQKQYLIELFSGEYDEQYFERRLKIGIVHNKIGLTPRWYLGSYSIYTQALVGIVRKEYFFMPWKATKAIQAINKILTIDAQLAIDTYIYSLLEDLKGVTTSRDVIENAVNNLNGMISNIAGGDLTQRIEISGNDDLSDMGSNLNKMTDSLSQMARQVTAASNTLFATLAQLQSAVQAQTANISEQAASVNETITTIEEIKVTSAQTMEKAQFMGKTAERTRQEGEQGLQVVGQINKTMETIKEKVENIAENILSLSGHTQQVGEITNTVTNLAQQLKMLALNAAIEAGKAGEAGLGFAVVAGEVKELAEQAQESTAQVQRILRDIQQATDKAVMVTEEGSKGVDEGLNYVKQTAATFENLANVIKESSLASQQIVAAVRQEVTAIDQIVVAMEDINRATTDFVGASHQTKLAAEGVGEIAEQLRSSASVYKV